MQRAIHKKRLNFNLCLFKSNNNPSSLLSIASLIILYKTLHKGELVKRVTRKHACNPCLSLPRGFLENMPTN